jgi:hypothetical protein
MMENMEMPIYRTRMRRRQTTEFIAIVEVEAEGSDEAMVLLTDLVIEPHMQGYRVAEDSEDEFFQCSVDGVAWSNNFGTPSEKP